MKSDSVDELSRTNGSRAVRLRIERHDFAMAFWATTAAFGCYFCMYAFRKPFTAASFNDTQVWGIGFKTVLVTSQVAGYMISKFIGIKVISEMPPHRRAITMFGLVLVAEFALILFGLMPRPLNAICLFANGLPLGMVFGLVQGFLEGRRLTELLTAGLCASFILADGVTKSVGAWLLSQGISEDWMPSIAGMIFLPPFAVCVGQLARTPPPTDQDIAARSKRDKIEHSDRMAFVDRHAVGLVPLVVMYLLVTILRSIRNDFAPEIWKELGTPAIPGVFTTSEMFVAFGVLVVNGLAILVTDNRRAYIVSLATCGFGFGLMTITVIAQSRGQIDAFTFMVLIGLALYLPYVAVHTTLFERILAMTRERGNVGFLMYFADSIGYLGYVAVMLVRNYSSAKAGILGLLLLVSWVSIGMSTVCLIISGAYFSRLKLKTSEIARSVNVQGPGLAHFAQDK